MSNVVGCARVLDSAPRALGETLLYVRGHRSYSAASAECDGVQSELTERTQHASGPIPSYTATVMASAKDTATFFQHGTSSQFEQVLSLYPQALKLKAERKTKKPEELIKLDNW